MQTMPFLIQIIFYSAVLVGLAMLIQTIPNESLCQIFQYESLFENSDDSLQFRNNDFTFQMIYS